MEKTHESTLVKGIEALGGECLKLKFVSGRGFPDRMCLLENIRKAIYVELKDTDDDNLSPQQKAVAARLIKQGEIYYVLHGEQPVHMLLEMIKVMPSFFQLHAHLTKGYGLRIRESGQAEVLDLTGY